MNYTRYGERVLSVRQDGCPAAKEAQEAEYGALLDEADALGLAVRPLPSLPDLRRALAAARAPTAVQTGVSAV